MISEKKDEQFSIDLFLHVIESSAWNEFCNEFIFKDGDFMASRHPLRMMASYPDFMFEGVTFVDQGLGEDF